LLRDQLDDRRQRPSSLLAQVEVVASVEVALQQVAHDAEIGLRRAGRQKRRLGAGRPGPFLNGRARLVELS
jgi:hypothetical protein